MKVFHELAFEGYVLGGTSNVFTDPALMEALGSVDTLHWSGYSAQVTGATPTLSLNEFYSNDKSIWYNTLIVPILNGLSLSTSGETLFQAIDAFPGAGRFAFGRLQIALAPATARAFLRIWVTGRDLSHRAAPTGATGNGQVPLGSYSGLM